MSPYIIGIDLGTTNSALAMIEAAGEPRVRTFAIPQLVAPGEVAERPLLPSFLYLPGPHDLPPGACGLPWDPARGYAVGEFAREHGGRVQGRLVTSAKSWLCHDGVNRRAPLLPWTAPPEVERVSPVDASARFLGHLAEAWNHHMAAGKQAFALERQTIVLTVPASFDDVARNLTVEAARKAGIERLTLLEEPQAAFYAWMAAEAERRQAARLLQPGMTCLVLDVGGGTSDFTLIQVAEQQGELAFVRRAVGDHLLLGGDNMDLALARHVEARLPGGRLEAAPFAALVQACRRAKETLLGPEPPPEHTVTVVGRGRKVVGGAVSAALTPQEVGQVLLDGFLPFVPADAAPARPGRAGLHEMGLPYVSDPALTRHIAGFLAQHGVDGDRPPDAVLFNGGVFQPQSVRNRLLEVMHRWYDRPSRPWRPVILAGPSLDLAVAWGAAYYGWLRQTGGRRIAGGLSRSYYLAVARETAAVPQVADHRSVLCVVPQHLEEGGEIHLEEPELDLALGQPVSFPIYTSTVRPDDRPGAMLSLAPGQLLRLPPLCTILRGGKRSGTRTVPVTIAARLTEIGTLELYLVARDESGRRWRLEFNVREGVREPGEPAAAAGAEAGAAVPGLRDVWPEELVEKGTSLIRDAFASRTEEPARNLTRLLEEKLEAARQDWPTALCRRLGDMLLDLAANRQQSAAHLSRWCQLTGYCLRPGFGDALDRFRIEKLWKLLQAPSRQGDGGKGRAADGADAWILWRRVSGGLSAALQQALLDRLRPVLAPSKSAKAPPYKPGANELAEMWRAAASLERVDTSQKEALGQALLKQVRRSPAPTYGFWALTRLGGRRLLYGPLNAVLHPSVVEGWLEGLLGFQPGNESERQGWLFCLAQLSRRTGQRALDIGEQVRERVGHVLRAAGASPHLVGLAETGSERETAEESQLFGESLPMGLVLREMKEG